MDPELPAPANWTVRQTPKGCEIRCTRRAGEGRLAAWIFILALIAVCGYGASVFLLGWSEGEQILAGEVVLFLLLTGGLAAGLYLATAMFRTTTYLLGPQSLTISTAQPVVGRSTHEIDRSLIREVIRQAGLPQDAHGHPSWRTLIIVDNPSDVGPRRIAFEGEMEAESLWLAPLIGQWAGRVVHIQHGDAA